jgi:transposase
MTFGPTPQERAMQAREVILRVLSGELTWLQGADILGWSPRTMRRWRSRWLKWGVDGLRDRRRRPSPRRAAGKEVTPVLRLYRGRYRGFNVRHFHAVLCREHGFRYSYSFLRQLLQTAGLVKKKRPRGRHRLRREPRAQFGELLHLDGSPHVWLALRPQERCCLISVVDDATKRLLYAHLVEQESSQAVFEALAAVFATQGLPMALYTDRASWAAFTPKAGEPVDKTRRTQVGRALHRLGVEHILAYSPQARGRSERINRTLQGRLVNELRVARIRTLEAANRYLQERFLPAHNQEFVRPPVDPIPAFAPVSPFDLAQILCFQEQRVVGKDNTVVWEARRLQIPRQPGRATCAGLEVLVRRHLNGSYSVWRGTRPLATFDPRGRLLTPKTQTAPALQSPVGAVA